jgi:hypothetical protein
MVGNPQHNIPSFSLWGPVSLALHVGVTKKKSVITSIGRLITRLSQWDIQYSINRSGLTELKSPQQIERGQNEIARLQM